MAALYCTCKLAALRLVDPLDGTKEFISRNGEFTVNIALIENGQPVLGVVHVPVSQTTYFGGTAVAAAWKQVNDKEPTSLETNQSLGDGTNIRLVASRNHRGELVDAMIERLEGRFAEVEVVSMGSSLKLCLIAKGKADLYPRLAPTSEWDTAAAHAVVRAAGGDVFNTDLQPLLYNQKDRVLNPHFLVIGKLDYDWGGLLRTSQ